MLVLLSMVGACGPLRARASDAEAARPKSAFDDTDQEAPCARSLAVSPQLEREVRQLYPSQPQLALDFAAILAVPGLPRAFVRTLERALVEIRPKFIELTPELKNDVGAASDLVAQMVSEFVLVPDVDPRWVGRNFSRAMNLAHPVFEPGRRHVLVEFLPADTLEAREENLARVIHELAHARLNRVWARLAPVLHARLPEYVRFDGAHFYMNAQLMSYLEEQFAFSMHYTARLAFQAATHALPLAQVRFEDEFEVFNTANTARVHVTLARLKPAAETRARMQYGIDDPRVRRDFEGEDLVDVLARCLRTPRPSVDADTLLRQEFMATIRALME